MKGFPVGADSAGREEVRSYGGEVLAGRATRVTRTDDDRFRVELAGGHSIVARRVLAATGLSGRAPRHRRPRGALGARRHPLPVLPWLRGPRPAHRPDRHPPDGAPHRRVVPPAERPAHRCAPRPCRRGHLRARRPASQRRGRPARAGEPDRRRYRRPRRRRSSWPTTNASTPTRSWSAPGSGCAPNRSRRSASNQWPTRAGSETSWRRMRPGQRQYRASTRPAT